MHVLIGIFQAIYIQLPGIPPPPWNGPSLCPSWMAKRFLGVYWWLVRVATARHDNDRYQRAANLRFLGTNWNPVRLLANGFERVLREGDVSQLMLEFSDQISPRNWPWWNSRNEPCWDENEWGLAFLTQRLEILTHFYYMFVFFVFHCHYLVAESLIYNQNL